MFVFISLSAARQKRIEKFSIVAGVAEDGNKCGALT
jgi:hypothetical protein